MFISDNIVFIDLPKCASSNIQRLMGLVLDGRKQGTHVPASDSLINSGRQFWSSIRNPWEWYLSLWAYGCDGKGALYQALTTDLGWLRSRGWKNSIPGAILNLFGNPRRHRQAWMDSYADVNEPDCFRAWLNMLHSPGYAADIGDNYARGLIAGFAGLLTYRYLKLCCTGSPRSVQTPEALEAFDAEACYIDHFIRVENLQDDLLGLLTAAGEAISDAHEAEFRSKRKMNVSSRRRPADFYYDEASAELVGRRDRLIVEKFAYKPPL